MRDKKGKFISEKKWQAERGMAFREEQSKYPGRIPLDPGFYQGSAYTAKPDLDALMAQSFGEWIWEWFVIVFISVIVGCGLGLLISYLF